MPLEDTNQVQIKKIQKTNIEPNEFIPSDSFHEVPNKENVELMQIKGRFS